MAITLAIVPAETGKAGPDRAENVIYTVVPSPDLPHLTRTATTLVTGVAGFLGHNPGSFAEKVSQRFRHSPLGRPLSMLSGIIPGVSEHERLGQLDLATQNTRVKHFRELLAHQPDYTPRFHGQHHGPVIHLLTNSLPHTTSGYALRSHGVLTALRDIGIEALAVTRLGYPVTVGRVARSRQELVDAIPYRRLLPWIMPSSALKTVDNTAGQIIRIARETDAWAIHTTTPFENALAAEQAARTLGIPWIYEVRGEPELTWLSRFNATNPIEMEKALHSQYFRGRRAQEAALAKRADAVVALSKVSAQQLTDRGVDPERITVVPNAFDAGLIHKQTDREALRRELNLPDKPLIGSVSAIVGYEGFDTLIRALEYLPEAVAVIVGDGTERPALIQLAETLGLTDRVIFPGRTASGDAWKWYGALDVFVVPRRDTPVCRTVTPIKPLAALALQVPVVASDLPALREVTGNLGTYAEPDNPRALAAAIRAAAQEKPIDATDFLRTRTWDAIGQIYANMYSGLRERINTQ